MSFPVYFERDKAKRYATCLEYAAPIPGPWTPCDALLLAGACRVYAGGRCYPPANGTDLDAAIGMYAELCRAVADGTYDAVYEPTVVCVVATFGGRRVIERIRGFRTEGAAQ